MKKVLFLILILFGCLGSFSQVAIGKADYPKVIQPSPEVAALGRYGEVPVSLFSGQANIGVPIYLLKVGDIEVNVSLSYNSSGIKVDEYATSVGLGWTLNAGGTVTRAVLGVPDNINDASYPAISFDPNINPNLPIEYHSQTPNLPDYYFAKDVVENNRDLERDIYYINFQGISGKFVFDRLGNPLMIPANPSLKIQPIAYPNPTGFIITDDKGYKYHFETGESILEITNQCTVGYESPREFNGGINTSFLLTKIQSPTGWVVDFEYETYEYTIKRRHTEVKNIVVPNPNGCLTPPSDRDCNRFERIEGKRLTKIKNTASSSEVVFVYDTNNRLDMPFNSQNQGKALTGINVVHNSVLKKSWNLNYTYFFSNGVPTRLKLLSVQENNLPPYEFFYEESNPLPPLFTFAQDYWGYSNGKQNLNTLIPPDPQIGVFTGADRSPDFNFMKSGALVKIKYPTGGHTGFLYEPHLNTVTENVVTYQNETASLAVVSGSGTTVTEVTFTLPETATDIAWSWNLVPGNYDDEMYGYIMSGNTVIHTASGVGNGVINALGTVTLQPGNQYKLRIVRATVDDDGTLFISWRKSTTNQVTSEKIVFGGLRIKEVSNYTDANILQTKKIYSYNSLSNPAYSTAILPENHSSYYNFRTYVEAGATINDPGDPQFYQCGYNVLSSSSVPQLGNGLDVSIGYQQVIEMDGSDAINGRTIYTYSSSDADLGINIGGSSQDWCKGLLLTRVDQKKVSSSFVDVKKSENKYTSTFDLLCYTNPSTCGLFQYVIPAKKINYIRREFFKPDGISPGVDAYLPAIFEVENYFTHVAPVFLSETKTTDYDPTGTNSLVNKTEYFYQGTTHAFPTALETRASNNVITRLENKYPVDKIASGNNPPNDYDGMVAANIVSPVVEQRLLKEGIEVSKTRTNYSKWNGAFFKPSSIESAVFGNSFSTDIAYQVYDSKGNLLKFTARDGIAKTYIWDYYQLYPIAEGRGDGIHDMAFTSFEGEGTGGWTINSGTFQNAQGISGKKIFSGSVSRTLAQTGDYIVTLWLSPGGTATINGIQGAHLKTNATNGWKFYSWTLNGVSSINITGSEMDELRLFPAKSEMTTYTYDPLIGMTSQANANNSITYYEYDGIGRLKTIRDDNGYIVKHWEYKYAAPIPGSSCGSNCVIMQMRTFTNYNTPGYPVGVFNINKQYLGSAQNADDFIGLWNGNAVNQAVGVLSKTSDPLHFNLTLASNATAPAAVHGLRYYQLVGYSGTQINIRTDVNTYVDWGDGQPGNLILGPRVMMYDYNPYGYVPLRGDAIAWVVPWTHTYSSSQSRTITIFHNETTEAIELSSDVSNSTEQWNIVGNYPEQVKSISYNDMPNASDIGVVNFPSLSNVVHYHHSTGSTFGLSHWQSISGFHKLKWTKFISSASGEISGDFRKNFPDLLYLEIQGTRPDMSTIYGVTALPKLYVSAFGTLTQPAISSAEIDQILIKHAATNVNNGYLGFYPRPQRTHASDAAYQQLLNRGWYVSEIINP
jgi:hypothetical protein